jgi:hypothetical protein
MAPFGLLTRKGEAASRERMQFIELLRRSASGQVFASD